LGSASVLKEKGKNGFVSGKGKSRERQANTCERLGKEKPFFSEIVEMWG